MLASSYVIGSSVFLQLHLFLGYFLGTAADKTDQMGIAYSSDLLHWTEALDAPVLPRGGGAYDRRLVGVVATAGVFALGVVAMLLAPSGPARVACSRSICSATPATCGRSGPWRRTAASAWWRRA